MTELILIKPSGLTGGDTVAIVAPASNIKTNYLERGAAEIERLGFRVKYRDGIFSRGWYTAGSDQRRAAELMEAFADPEIKAVWAARGGYGSMRLFDLLDEELLRQNPKIFIGYSDLTALHLYFYRRFGWVTFHGPMAAKDMAGGEDHYDRRSLLSSIVKAAPPIEIASSRLEILHSGNDSRASGRLLGGCLSLIVAMLGTPYELDTGGCILFLEDTGVKPFAIDRMLQHLKLAGKLKDARAIIFGEMTDCLQHPDQGYRIQDVLAECTLGLGIPVLFGLPSGHSPHGNLTLPLGINATLDIDNGTLSFNERAVI